MLEHMLHNRLVCRTNDKATKQPLLTKNKSTYIRKHQKLLQVKRQCSRMFKNLGLYGVHGHKGIFTLVDPVHTLKSGK